MKYNINNLNSQDFEHLCQSLSKKIFGVGTLSFGAGPDGGREATFNGKADYPGKLECWEGYWVIQAKFRDVRSEAEARDIGLVEKMLDRIQLTNEKVVIMVSALSSAPGNDLYGELYKMFLGKSTNYASRALLIGLLREFIGSQASKIREC